MTARGRVRNGVVDLENGVRLPEAQEVTVRYADAMAVHLTPELEKQLDDLVAKTGLTPERLLEEALSDYSAGGMASLDWSQCSVVERVPEKVSGAWLLQGTRMPVATIFENLGAGANIDDLVKWFDGLDREQVKAVIDFVTRSLDVRVCQS